MKRLLLLVAVLVPLSLFIAGCGNGSVQRTAEPTVDQKKQMQEQMMKNMAKAQKGAPATTAGDPARK